MVIISNQPFIAFQLATALSIPLRHLILKPCDNGELLVSVDKSFIHKQKITIVHALDCPLGSSLMDLLVMIDAVKSAKPESLTLILPYYAYGRQNHPTHDSTGSAGHLVMRLLATTGIDQLVTVDIHAPSLLKKAPFKVYNLSSIPLFAHLVQGRTPSPLIIAPDQGATGRAKALAEQLKTDWSVLKKKRTDKGIISISSLDSFEKRNCLIVDDIVDSGKTLCLAADYLLKKGAAQVDAVVTHGLFSKGCLERINQSCLQSLIITNTVPLSPIILSPKVTLADITPVLVQGLNANRLFPERNKT